MELTTTKWRDYFGVGYQTWFVFGYMVQAGLSYRWRNWHDLMVMLHLMFIVCKIYNLKRSIYRLNKRKK